MNGLIRVICADCGRPFITEVCEEGCCNDKICGACEVAFDLWDEQMAAVDRGL